MQLFASKTLITLWRSEESEINMFIVGAHTLGVSPHQCCGYVNTGLGIEKLNLAKLSIVDVRKLPGYKHPTDYEVDDTVALDYVRRAEKLIIDNEIGENPT